jgi:hypothetical protein
MRVAMRGLLLLVLGVAGALVGQFALDRWADASDLGHWIQHGVLFWSGLLAGAGLMTLYRQGQRPV